MDENLRFAGLSSCLPDPHSAVYLISARHAIKPIICLALLSTNFMIE